LLLGLLRDAQRHGSLPAQVDPEALTRVYLALFPGFILQQAWEPEVDVHAYVDVLKSIIDGTLHGAPGD
jgi:hypothetical protein